MSEPLAEAELAEIRARLEAATPEPWTLRVHEDETGEREAWPNVDLGNEDNRVLIAHAPTDIARLLGEVKRLREHAALVEETDKEIFAEWEVTKREHKDDLRNKNESLDAVRRMLTDRIDQVNALRVSLRAAIKHLREAQGVASDVGHPLMAEAIDKFIAATEKKHG